MRFVFEIGIGVDVDMESRKHCVSKVHMKPGPTRKLHTGPSIMDQMESEHHTCDILAEVPVQRHYSACITQELIHQIVNHEMGLHMGPQQWHRRVRISMLGKAEPAYSRRSIASSKAAGGHCPQR